MTIQKDQDFVASPHPLSFQCPEGDLESMETTTLVEADASSYQLPCCAWELVTNKAGGRTRRQDKVYDHMSM